MQPDIQRPHTRPMLLIVTLLIAQALATAFYRLFGFDTVGLDAGGFLKNVIFFVTTTPIDITQPCTWSVCVSLQNFAIVRHGVSEEIGHGQNKQTLKYLVRCLSYSVHTFVSTQ